MLPSWNHMTNLATNTTPRVSAPSPSTVSAKLQNFALVYMTSSVSGSVDNSSGSNAGILVETAMCDPYVADGDTTQVDGNDVVSDICEWGRVMRTESAGRGGDYEFDGLMEGYYAVWFTGGGFAAARMGTGGADDDAAEGTEVEMRTGSATGRNAYLVGQDFNIYSKRASDADVLDSWVSRESS